MRFGGIVLATVLVLSACTSEPAPREPSPSASSASAPPTRAAPTMPPQASEDSAEGAAAFVHHYVDVFNYAAATGDVDELTRLSSPDCDGCQRYIDLYRDTYEAGGYFKGGDWKLGELQVRFNAQETYVTTEMGAAPSLYREKEGSAEKRDPGEKSTLSFAVAKPGAAWKVTQFGLGPIE